MICSFELIEVYFYPLSGQLLGICVLRHALGIFTLSEFDCLTLEVVVPFRESDCWHQVTSAFPT